MIDETHKRYYMVCVAIEETLEAVEKIIRQKISKIVINHQDFGDTYNTLEDIQELLLEMKRDNALKNKEAREMIFKGQRRAER